MPSDDHRKHRLDFSGLGGASSIQTDKSPHEHDSIPPKMNSVLDASEAGWRAQEWIKANPDAWRYAERLALAEAQAKRHFSFAWVMAQVRKKAFGRGDGEPFTVNNSLTPALARIFVQSNPDAEPFLEFRKSACDWFFTNDET